MYLEFSGESPSAVRSFLIALFRLCSKSTKVSEDHSVCRISSRVTVSPGFSSRIDKMRKGWPDKRIRTPCLRSSRPARFAWNTPKRSTRLDAGDFVSTTSSLPKKQHDETTLPIYEPQLPKGLNAIVSGVCSVIKR